VTKFRQAGGNELREGWATICEEGMGQIGIEKTLLGWEWPKNDHWLRNHVSFTTRVYVRDWPY